MITADEKHKNQFKSLATQALSSCCFSYKSINKLNPDY